MSRLYQDLALDPTLLEKVESQWMQTMNYTWQCCGASGEDKRPVWPLLIDTEALASSPSPLAEIMRTLCYNPPAPCPYCQQEGERVNRIQWPANQDAVRLLLAVHQTGALERGEHSGLHQWEAAPLDHDYVMGLLSYDRRVPQATALAGVYRIDSVLRPRFYTVLSREGAWYSVEEKTASDLEVDVYLPAEDELHLLMVDVKLIKHRSGPRKVRPPVDAMDVDDEPTIFPSSPLPVDPFITSTGYTNLTASPTYPSSPLLSSYSTHSVPSSPSTPGTPTLGENEEAECEECGEPRSLLEPCEICGAL